MMLDTYALERALQSADEVAETCKKAFGVGFLHEIELQLSRKGFALHEFHNGLGLQMQRWRSATADAKSEEGARMRLTLEMAKSLTPLAGLAEGTALSLLFSNITLSYLRTIRAAHQLGL